jgi:hypothetical protein
VTEYLLSVDAFLEKTAAGIDLFSALKGGTALLQDAKTVTNNPSLIERALSRVGKFIKDEPGWSAAIGGTAALGGLGYLAYPILQKKMQTRAQDKAFAQVSHGDAVLSEASKEELNTAFQTMRNFAPTLATDPNAVQSFLRSAVMSGGGVDYNTIKLLAETENAATGRFRKE